MHIARPFHLPLLLLPAILTLFPLSSFSRPNFPHSLVSFLLPALLAQVPPLTLAAPFSPRVALRGFFPFAELVRGVTAACTRFAVHSAKTGLPAALTPEHRLQGLSHIPSHTPSLCRLHALAREPLDALKCTPLRTCTSCRPHTRSSRQPHTLSGSPPRSPLHHRVWAGGPTHVPPRGHPP